MATETKIATVQLDRWASKLNRDWARGKCSSRLALCAAVLVFQSLSPDQKAKWLSEAQVKSLGED